MKLKNLLLESQHYNFSIYGKPDLKGKGVQVEYVFSSDENDYGVMLRKSVELVDGSEKEFNYWISAAYKVIHSNTPRELTGEGNARKVVRTFFEVIQDFVDKFWDDIDDDFEGIRISSVGQDEELRRKRHRVYKKFAKRYFPGSKIREDGTEFFIHIDGET